MYRNLLYVFYLICTSTIVQAQSSIFATTTGCPPIIGAISGRFDFNGTINGKYDYVYSEDSRLHIGFDGTRWLLYGNTYDIHGFENTNVTESLVPPENGWVPTNCPSDRTFNITYSQQIVEVSAISVRGQDGATSVSENSTLQMEAVISPANADDKSVTWSVTNGTGSATISSSGLLTGTAQGTVTVTATANDGSEVSGSTQITITDDFVAVTGISIQGGDAVDLNGTLQLRTNVFPSNATNKNVVWEVIDGTGSATISSTGLLRGTALGEVLVRAAAQDGSGIIGERTIEVVEPFVEVTAIGVQGRDGANSVEVGNSLQMDVLVLPSNATNKRVSWSVINGTGSATISTTGLLRAVSIGQVTVRATATDGSGEFGEVSISIVNPDVILVNDINIVSGTGSFDVEEGNTLPLIAEIFPSNATDRSVSWTVSNETGQATISQNGVLTAIQEGTVLVTCRANDDSNEFSTRLVNVTAREAVLVSSLEIVVPNNQTELEEGSTLQLSVNVLPNNADNKGVTWTIVSQGGQATISSNGLLTAVSAGSIRVLVESSDIGSASDSREFTITEPVVAVSSIQLENPTANDTLQVGDSLKLNATVLPVDATDASLTWTVNELSGEANILPDGTVIGVTPGIIQVTATSNSDGTISDSYELFVKVREVFVSELRIIAENNQSSIKEGSSLQFSVQIMPDDVTNPAVSWRVDRTDLATIDNNGLLNANAEGTLNVIVETQDGSNVSDTFMLQIVTSDVLVSTLTVMPRDTIIKEGEMLQLRAFALPENATNKALQWEVINQTGAGIINATGLFTATSPGNVVVRAQTTDGSELIADVDINIEAIKLVESIDIVGASDTLYLGDSLQLSANILPQDAENGDIRWTISDSTLASLSSNGLVKARTEGSVWVYAAALDTSGVVDSVEIVLKKPDVLVSEIILNDESSVTIFVDETYTLNPVVLPDTADNKVVEYTVESVTGNGIILGNGLFTPTETGTVNIIASSTDGSNIRDTLEIIIKDTLVLVNRINLSNLPDTLYLGDSIVLSAQVQPADATNKQVDWSIIVGADAADLLGTVLIGKAEGTLTIQATAQDASRVIAQHRITVLRNPARATYFQDSIVTCGTYESPSMQYSWDSSGVYQDTIDNYLGHDSIITLALNFIELNDAIEQNDSGELEAASEYGSYTWLDCSNDESIVGATSQRYLPMDPGLYRVQINLGTCSVQSTCLEYSTVSNSSTFEIEPMVYPNPSYGFVQIALQVPHQDVIMQISDMAGRLIQQRSYKQIETIQVEGLQKGFYLLHLQTAKAQGTFKLIVQ